MVTIAPDFHGAHHGYITNLKKFTAYFTSVLCFTTPGDGPPSTPQLVRTHEDSEYPSVVVAPAAKVSPPGGPTAVSSSAGRGPRRVIRNLHVLSVRGACALGR